MRVPTILIVDDEELVVEGIKKNIEAAGYKAVTILGGREAIEYVKKNHVDVVIVDLVMPGMNGVETCRGIKQVSPDTDVLLLSGFPQEVDRLLMPFLDAGGRDMCLRKPLFGEEVEDALKKILAEREKLGNKS